MKLPLPTALPSTAYPLAAPKHSLIRLERALGFKLLAVRLRIESLNHGALLGFAVASLLLPAVALSVLFTRPHTTHFSFATDTCFFNPALLPNTTLSQNSSGVVRLQHQPRLSIGNIALLSHTSCLTLTQAPTTTTLRETVQLRSLGLFEKNIRINSTQLPKPTLSSPKPSQVSAKATLVFSLDQADHTFSYSLNTEGATLACNTDQENVSCELSELELPQGSQQDVSLIQELGSSNIEALRQTITILEPLTITSASIAPESMVYNDPATIALSTSQPLEPTQKPTVSLQDEEGNYHPITSTIDGTNELSLQLGEPLKRQKNYTLTIENLTARNKSYLNAPYQLSFTASGGPQVLQKNIGAFNVPSTGRLVLTFDTLLNPNQNPSDYLSLSDASNSAIAFSSVVRDNRLTIMPSQPLGRCRTFSITLNDQLTNSYGIGGGSAWSFTARTTCQEVFSIGSSVQGRPLTAHKFGSGPTTILFVGGMHGDEKSSVLTLTSFIDYLEEQYPSIPTDKTIVVIPNSNPDGYAASRRVNANNIDLNRNFPTFDWQTGIYMPRGVFLENGGGSSPLSEPEAAALAAYTERLRPRLTLTFHATGSAVFANDAGDSKALADLYARNARFASFTSADTDTFFAYPTTGEYEDWIRDRLGLPALLVELTTVNRNEFTRQLPALWAMLGI